MSRIWTAAVALTAFLAGPAHAGTATLSTGASCDFASITMDSNLNLAVTCYGPGIPPLPTPKPDPVPTPPPPPTTPPPGGCAALPSNAVMQTMFPGGTNNYVFDDYGYRNPGHTPASANPVGSMQIFPLPKTWPNGKPVTMASIQFASYIIYNLAGAKYEVSIARCPGDFETYKRDTPTQGMYPCGKVDGADFTVNAIVGVPSGVDYCGIPAGEQWYMNWRATCPSGLGTTCGQTFYVPGGG